MHSSDETGDERKGLTAAGGTAAEGDPAKLPAHAFRERIRRASVAAAQSSVSAGPGSNSIDASSGLPDASAPSRLAPEQSGVHDRKSDEPEAPSKPVQAQPANKADAPASTDPGSGSPVVPAGGGSGFQGAVASGMRRPTPPAWPFAAGTRDDRRPQYHTQLGLGMPQRTAAPGASEPADSEMSEARRRADTRDTKRSGAPAKSTSAPTTYKITPPRPFRSHDASKWSPTSTKPQRASLLRAEPKPGAAAVNAGTSEQPDLSKTAKQGGEAEPNIQGDIATSLDSRQSEVSRLAAAPLDPGKYSLRKLADDQSRRAGGGTMLDGAGKAQGKAARSTNPDIAQNADESTRARRYTPKQRPTQRRARGAGKATAKGPEPTSDHTQDYEHEEVDPRELAVTVPDLRIPASVRPPALPLSPGGQLNLGMNVTRPGPGPSQVVTPDTPTQPRGRPVPRLPFAAPPASAFSPPAAFSQSPAFAPPKAFSQRPNAAFQPAGPRSPFPPAVTHRDGDGAFSQHEASIVVDPTLHGTFTEVHPHQQVTEAPTGYQPLPSDPAAFEQMMREQAAARGSRLNWKQQATLVIPRESLGVPEERRLINPKVVFGSLAASAVGALLMVGISQFSDQGTLRVATDTSTSAAHAAGSVTVIATEPSGAELLLDGAVVGNAPLEVVRPPLGHGEHTYVVRLRGFTQELVRLTADSQPAIRVTLTPESGVP